MYTYITWPSSSSTVHLIPSLHLPAAPSSEPRPLTTLPRAVTACANRPHLPPVPPPSPMVDKTTEMHFCVHVLYPLITIVPMYKIVTDSAYTRRVYMCTCVLRVRRQPYRKQLNTSVKVFVFEIFYRHTSLRTLPRRPSSLNRCYVRLRKTIQSPNHVSVVDWFLCPFTQLCPTIRDGAVDRLNIYHRRRLTIFLFRLHRFHRFSFLFIVHGTIKMRSLSDVLCKMTRVS